MKTRILIAVFGTLLAASMCLSVQAQDRPIRERERVAAANDETKQCDRMIQMQKKMREQVRADDKQLEQLADKMKQAQGQEKVDAMAALLEKMVEQRAEMHERMMTMQNRRMRHMAEHMRMSPQATAQCPMIQDMDDAAGAEPHHSESSTEESEQEQK